MNEHFINNVITLLFSARPTIHYTLVQQEPCTRRVPSYVQPSTCTLSPPTWLALGGGVVVAGGEEMRARLAGARAEHSEHRAPHTRSRLHPAHYWTAVKVPRLRSPHHSARSSGSAQCQGRPIMRAAALFALLVLPRPIVTLGQGIDTI